MTGSDVRCFVGAPASSWSRSWSNVLKWSLEDVHAIPVSLD